MEHPLAPTMAYSAKIKRDMDCNICQINHKSRGWYICTPCGRWHLHHDGEIKDGVGGRSEKPAFWPTEEKARDFYSKWKSQVLSEST